MVKNAGCQSSYSIKIKIFFHIRSLRLKNIGSAILIAAIFLIFNFFHFKNTVGRKLSYQNFSNSFVFNPKTSDFVFANTTSSVNPTARLLTTDRLLSNCVRFVCNSILDRSCFRTKQFEPGLSIRRTSVGGRYCQCCLSSDSLIEWQSIRKIAPYVLERAARLIPSSSSPRPLVRCI